MHKQLLVLHLTNIAQIYPNRLSIVLVLSVIGMQYSQHLSMKYLIGKTMEVATVHTPIGAMGHDE